MGDPAPNPEDTRRRIYKKQNKRTKSILYQKEMRVVGKHEGKKKEGYVGFTSFTNIVNNVVLLG